MLKYHVKEVQQDRLHGQGNLVFKEYHECSQCHTRVQREDEYCRRCGQHFDLIEEVNR